MNRTLKIVLYVLLAIAAAAFAVQFRSAHAAAKAARDKAMEEPPEPAEIATNALPMTSTNQPATGSGTNGPGALPPLPLTNVALATNTNASNTALSSLVKSSERQPAAPAPTSITTGLSGMVLYGALCFLSVVGIGVLLAYDISHFAAERFYKFILSDDGEGPKDPEYENAEKLWANGQHLEAIQLMRDYQRKNPRKLYVAIRIAEIYEKDLGNHLAAALEYEEVLKHPLMPEQWSWSAIHLANLYYGKLDQPEKAMAWLRRIVKEHGRTAAAAKARARLEQLEGGPPETAEALVPEQSPSALPKGFRPLKDK